MHAVRQLTARSEPCGRHQGGLDRLYCKMLTVPLSERQSHNSRLALIQLQVACCLELCAASHRPLLLRRRKQIPTFYH